jgi:hypothetical protein
MVRLTWSGVITVGVRPPLWLAVFGSSPCGAPTDMPQFSDSIDIARPPEDVWRASGPPERWFEGYLETRSRSAGHPRA